MIKQLKGLAGLLQKSVESQKGGKELFNKAGTTVKTEVDKVKQYISPKKEVISTKEKKSSSNWMMPTANAAPIDNKGEDDPELQKMMQELDQINQKEYGKSSIFGEDIKQAEAEGDTEFANLLREAERIKNGTSGQDDLQLPPGVPKPRTVGDFLVGGRPEELEAKSAEYAAKPKDKSFLDKFLTNLNPQTYIDKSFAPTLNTLTGGASGVVGEKIDKPIRELNRGLTNFAATNVEGLGNLVGLAANLKGNPMIEKLKKQGYSEEEAFRLAAGPIEKLGKNIQEGASTVGRSMREGGSEATGIDNESISGGVGDIAGLVFGAGKLGKVAKTEQITAKAAPKIIKGAENLGSKLFSGKSGYVADKARNTLNFVGNNADKISKASARNVVETNLASAFSNGQVASKEDLVFATGLQAIPALAQYKLKQKAINKYKNAVGLFSGKEESVEKFNDKVWSAIQSGYVGKNADDIYKKTTNDIKAGNKKVGEMLENADLKVSTEDVWKEGHDLIEELYRGGQFDKAKPIESALKEITGQKFNSTVAEVSNKISKVDEKIADATKRLDALEKAKPGAATSAAQRLAETKTELEGHLVEKSKLIGKAEDATKKMAFVPPNMDAKKLWELKNRGRERNMNIIKGQENQSTKDAAVNQLWLRLGSKANNILNTQIQGFKDLNRQLNVAHLVDDAVSPMLKKAEIVAPEKSLLKGLLTAKPGNLKNTVKAKRGQYASDMFKGIANSKLSKVGAVNFDNEIQSNASNTAQALLRLIKNTATPVLDTTSTVGTNLIKFLSPEVKKLLNKRS